MHQIVALPWPEQITYYSYRPGEPVTSPESIATAEAKLIGETQDGKTQ